MPLNPPSGFSVSQKTPAFVVGIEFGASGRSSGEAPMRIAVLANKTSAGTAVVETPTNAPGIDDARTLAGPGSRLFLAAKKAFEQFPGANIDLVPVAEPGGGTAATALLAFTGPATAAGTVRVTVNGELVDAGVSSGDSATVIGNAVRDAINAKTDWPVTATAATGTVTLTQKNKGVKGNDMMIHGALRDGLAGVTVALNGGTASAVRVDGKFGAGTATPGAGADDITNALASIATLKYDHIPLDQSDTTNWGRLVTHLNTYSGIAERRRQRGVVATPKDLASAITDAGSENALRLQIAWHYNMESTAGEVAVQAAAARIYGDGQVGGGVGKSKGEQAYRAANLDGTLLASIRVQVDPQDQPLGTEIEQALNNGLTPLAPAPATPGYCRIVRSITSRFKDLSGNPNYAVLDTSKVEVCDYAADRLEAFAANEFPNKNLAPDKADNALDKSEDVVTPSQIRAALAAELFRMEDENLVVRVAENLPNLLVEISSQNPGLALAYIPLDVIDGFHGLAMLLSQIG